MAYKLEDGKGSLWKNEKKTKDNSPDYTGKLNWKGDLISLAAWINEVQEGDHAGKKYLNIKAQPYEKPTMTEHESDDVMASGGKPAKTVHYSDSEEDIPF